jgi:hypothetical protein
MLEINKQDEQTQANAAPIPGNPPVEGEVLPTTEETLEAGSELNEGDESITEPEAEV